MNQRRFEFSIVVTLALGSLLGMAPRPASAADRDPALQTYLSANGLLNRGLYELAAAEYRKFLAESPTHEKAGVARYGLGVSLFRTQQYGESIKALTPIFQRDRFEYAAEVATILGQSHLALKRYDDAADAFNWVIQRRGDHALADEAAAGWIEALYLNDKNAEAVVAGQRFVSLWPDSPLRERAEFFHALSTMAQDKFAVAGERFAALLQRFPQGPFAHQASLLMAQCRQNDGSLEQAVKAYRNVLKQAGSRHIPDALYGLASLLQHLKQSGEAGQVLDRLLKQYPQSEFSDAARFLRGRTWFDQKEFGHATERFAEVLDGESKFADQATYWLAKCELRLGEFRPAAKRLARAIKRYPESDLLAEMHYDRGVALIRAERFSGALKALDGFRETFPSHKLVPEALRLAVVTEHQRKRFDESGTYCVSFLKQFGTHELAPSVAFLSGENEFLSGSYDSAVKTFQRFLSRYPDDVQARQAMFRLGTSLYRLDRFDEARDLLARIAEGTDTDDVFRPALLTLGDISFQRSEWKKAEAYLADYVAGGMDAPLVDDALLKLGLSRQRDDRPTEAIEAYDQLISRFGESPHRVQALFERGQALVALKRLDDAVTAFASVLEVDEESRFAAFALNHMAAIAAKRGRLEESSKLYARVASLAPEDDMKAEALFQQGQSFMSAQRFDEAEETFADFVSRYPSHDRTGTAYAKRAIAIARLDRFEDALKAIDDAEAHSLGDQDAALASAVRYEKAWCLRKLGRQDEAADAYRSLTSRDDIDSLGAHSMLELAEIEYADGAFENAAKLLRRVHGAVKDDDATVSAEVREQATYRLGLCEFKLAHHERAAELFEEFLATYVDSSLTASACFYGGESLLTLGRHERAVEHLARVPNEFASDPVCGPSLLRLGEALSTMQRWALSEKAFADYLDRFSDSEHSFQARFGLAWTREHQRRYDDAVSEYQKVVAGHQGPTAARAQFQIGECLFAQKKHNEAVREFLKVDILYAYPEWSAAALFEAGRCFEKLGKSVEARSHFKQVSDRHKESRWAKMATERLSAMPAAGVLGG